MTADFFIKKVLDGETEAFRYIIAEYKDMAYSIAMSIVKEEFYAEEILQVSFCKAYEKLDTFRGRAKFSTWLYRIVVNESFKVINKKKTEFIDFADDLPAVSAYVQNSVLKLEKDEQKYLINEALMRLSPKESVVLRLYYLEENNIEEVSNITGWSTANIKVLLHRARINLKCLLKRIYKIDKKEFY